jgi:hypothetical protein
LRSKITVTEGAALMDPTTVAAMAAEQCASLHGVSFGVDLGPPPDSGFHFESTYCLIAIYAQLAASIF